MKRLYFLFYLFCFVSFIYAQNSEFRATWVVTWQHITAGASINDNQALVRRIINDHSRANMSSILWQARQGGTVYYPSSYEPWGSYAGYTDPGYDHLAYAVEEAHKSGLELHAWFNVFQAASTYPGAPAAEHPEWICRDGNGSPMAAHIALSPGLSAVREYTIRVAMEIVRNYDIDGLHLDYIRWSEYSNTGKSKALAKSIAPETAIDGIIDESLIDELQQQNTSRYLWDIEHPYSAGIPDSIPGVPFSSWESWWRWSVTEFVRVLHDSIQTVKPWVRLSVAALGRYNWGPWNGYYSVFQDAALWYNEGYVDQLTPMHYHWTTGQDFVSALGLWYPYIQEGISDGRLYSVGPFSDNLLSINAWNRHKEIVEYSRTVPWTDGFQFFSYGSWFSRQYWEEASEIIFPTKSKVRAAQYLHNDVPVQPSVTGLRIDSAHYQINVSPDASIDQNQWFAIYRSNDDSLDVQNDEIINIHFGDSGYTFVDSISGLQDFNGIYRYYATMLDRYWNESSQSGLYLSDSIPSFAPQVVQTIPLSGDTVDVNSELVFTFSKTIDTEHSDEAFQINPSIPATAFIWSAGNKTLSVTLGQNFEFATTYTVTISDTLMDINGKRLDGDLDGNEGGNFSLEFTTKEADIDGPLILFSNPGEFLDAFDVEDILTVTFNELIEVSTVDETSVSLFRDSDPVPFDFKIFNVAGISTLSLQPERSLDPARDYTLVLSEAITDTAGNQMATDFQIGFSSEPYIYIDSVRQTIDEFYGGTVWKDPTYSGSTNGVDAAQSSFGIVDYLYLPGAQTPIQRRSAALHYVWNPLFLSPPGSNYLLREYCSALTADQPNPPVNVIFDTTYTLQCYIFGDGSYNKFRFAIDEGDVSSWPGHEVSNWITIDWIGWKLIEWDLSDPNGVGIWIGNQILDGSRYRIDSFQLTHDEGNANSGTLYFKDLRVVQKEYNIVGGISIGEPVPDNYSLEQNYPNPFNATTIINFTLAQPGKTSLIVYDMLGRKVITLVDKSLKSGHYQATFDAGALASGLYFYVLRSQEMFLKRKMILVK